MFGALCKLAQLINCTAHFMKFRVRLRDRASYRVRVIEIMHNMIILK